MLIKDLFTRYQIKPNGILHVGAHEGQEMPIYLEAGCDNVIWIEGNPDIFSTLRHHMFNYPNVQCIQALVSDIEGEEVDFNISNNEGQSSSILQFGTHSKQHPSVVFIDKKRLKTRRLDKIFSEPVTPFHIDFLVMDIQGMELRALKGMGNLLNQFKWVYLEVNRTEVYKGCGQIEEVDTYLAGFGFKRIETKWAGGWGDAYYSKM